MALGFQHFHPGGMGYSRLSLRDTIARGLLRTGTSALRLRWLHALIALGLFSATTHALQAAPTNALGDYVARPDDSFAWKQVGQKQADGITVVRLEYASQTWRDHPWRHQMLAVRPRDLRNPDVAVFLIT